MPTDVCYLVQISKKLVNSDFKNHRVEDPTRISSRQEKQVKKYVKEFFDKAVAKRREHDKKKAERQVKEGGLAESPTAVPDSGVKKEEESDCDEGMDLSDDEGKEKQASTTPVTPMDQIANGDGLKRKRGDEEGPNGVKPEDADTTPSKRPRSATPPPPPPPPPPAEALPVDHPTADDMTGYNNEGRIVDSFGVLGTPVQDESMEDVDPPPAPPPPTTAHPDHLDQDGMEMFDEVHSQTNFATSPTLRPADGGADAAVHGGYEVMNTKPLHRLEVHNGI